MSAEREKFEEGRALCACSKVKHDPEDLGGGRMRERHACVDCGTEFVRKGLIESLAEARPSVSGLPERPDWQDYKPDGFPAGGERGKYLQALEKYADAQSSRIVELEKERDDLQQKGSQLAGVLGNLAIHIHHLGLRKDPSTIYGDWGYKNERAELAEPKLAVCREETIKLRDIAERSVALTDCEGECTSEVCPHRLLKEVLSKLPTSVEEKKS